MRIAKFIPSQRALAAVLLAVLASALIWSVHAIAERLAIGSLLDATGHRLSIYVASLESEMRRYEYLPQVVGHDARVLALLERPDDAPLQRSVNEYLESIDALAGASAIYVIDEKGLTLAASNWRLPTSFVGAVYDYRPYFQDARKGLAGRFYGVGTVSNEPGYYFANAILSAQAVVGVAAVKVNLDQLDDSWGGSGEKIAVADGNGVVFLSSEPQWKFKTLYALSSETRRRLAATRQYWQEGSLKPLGLIEKRALGSRSAIVEVADARGSALPLPATQYLVDSRGISGTDWQLLVLADMAPVRSVARSSVAVAALTLILAAVVLLYLRQRHRSIAQVVAARAALQRANDELEHKVAARTDALSQSNRLLNSEVADRKRAEETLKATLEDLVHTARMAALGKMSASITHELNQPLAAIQTLSQNAQVLLERGRGDDARSNLQMIVKTIARMGAITGQLRKFARRAETDLAPTRVEAVLNDALFLLRQNLRERKVRLEMQASAHGVRAICNPDQLAQVLVNLISNAADAAEHRPDAAIEVTFQQADGMVRIGVHDNGPGISGEVEAHLFEPFFSTKAQGIGLGLGLAISNDIVRSFGGSLRAGRSALLGGALFTIELKAAAVEAIDA